MNCLMSASSRGELNRIYYSWCAWIINKRDSLCLSLKETKILSITTNKEWISFGQDWLIQTDIWHAHVWGKELLSLETGIIIFRMRSNGMNLLGWIFFIILQYSSRKIKTDSFCRTCNTSLWTYSFLYSKFDFKTRFSFKQKWQN